MYKVKKTEEGYLGLFATDTIKKGTVILWLAKDSTYVPYPTRTSIQIRNLHLEHYEGGYMNHHCEPSAEIVVNSRPHAGQGTIEPLVLAKRNIKEGEEITFDYESTEEVMSEPFHCKCHGRLIEGWNAFKRI